MALAGAGRPQAKTAMRRVKIDALRLQDERVAWK
jgi:hypothetical protein